LPWGCEALTEQVDSVIICSRDDAVALRLALVVEHVRPGVPLTTVHGRIVSSQLERAVSNIRVTSMAEIVTPTLAGPSLDDRLLWVRRTPEGFSGVRADQAKLQLVTIEAPGRHRWQQLLAGLGSLLAVAFTALFTAGVVERLLDRRLTTLFGSRRVPRKGHVVVVGLGQVGLRLCLLLRELGVPTVAVESDPDRYNVARAKNYGLPVVIGRGGSHFLLRRLSLHRARALAAVTSHEIENISVAVAALGMQDSLRTILRAGRGEVVNETRSLFRIGVVRDVYRIAGHLARRCGVGLERDGGLPPRADGVPDHARRTDRALPGRCADRFSCIGCARGSKLRRRVCLTE